jgi:ubiquinone/menaquinone biosynthesis C-methylase UbiE
LEPKVRVMNESSKWREKRIMNGDYRKYVNGNILDVGCGTDPVDSPFGKTRGWDFLDGDGQYLTTIEDNSFDCVYSSHSLEHMVDIEVTLTNWVRVLKAKGYLYLVIPDYDLYEKGKWPSTYNPDHKHSFSINKTREEVSRENHFNICIDLFEIFKKLHVEIKEVRLEDSGFDYNKFQEDQTLGNAESHILVVGQKRLR